MDNISSGVPLSNDDESVIHRTLPNGLNPPVKTSDEQLVSVYEIQRTIATIIENEFKKVALQFSDELLIDAASVVAALKAASKPETAFYVLGDTSYGSCCVDEVAAEHVDADVLVHYGRSCLSPTSKLPVIYVFGRLPFDFKTFMLEVSATITDKDESLLIVTDTTYISSQEQVVQNLHNSGFTTVVSSQLISTQDRDAGDPSLVHYTLPGRIYTLPANITLSSMTMLFIGPSSPTLTTTLMTHASLVHVIFSYDPVSKTLTRETTQNMALKRRYALVQKARDAGVIGIVVGTLGVSRYLDLIKHLRAMIAKAGKKSYLFAMGKLNPSKMANFSEIDAFVLVACGENSLIESRDFYKPVVTPFELSLALRTGTHDAVPWTNDWITDFERVLAMPEPESEAPISDEDNEAPHFSLVTGRYATTARPMYTGLETALDSDFAVAKRSGDTTIGLVGGLFSPAALHLNQRKHWTGLGTDHNATDLDEQARASDLSQGRSGIARDYS